MSGSLTYFAIAALGFVLAITLVSQVQHARAQQVAYAQFREELAQATAPTGQLDFNGELLALGAPVATMTSPDLGLEREVVFEGTTGDVLMKGPGHRRTTVLPGQAGVSVIYGRAWTYGAPFAALDDVQLGAVITVVTGQGEHTYEVTGVRRAGSVIPPPPDVASGAGRLTLVTVTGDPIQPRDIIYVDATLTSPAVSAPARVLGAASLLPAEDAMATDPEAWVDVALFLLAIAAVALAAAWIRVRWGARQTWLVAFPVLGVLLILGSQQVARLLPNLL